MKILVFTRDGKIYREAARIIQGYGSEAIQVDFPEDPKDATKVMNEAGADRAVVICYNPMETEATDNSWYVNDQLRRDGAQVLMITQTDGFWDVQRLRDLMMSPITTS